MMVRTSTLGFVILAMIGAAYGDELPDGPRPWKEAIYRSLYGPTKQIPVTREMTPLLPRSKPWHASLVVKGLDTRIATFCQGSVVAKGWVLTAASCVCPPGRNLPPIQVVVEHETSLKPERRFEVRKIWLYQNHPANFPRACFDDTRDATPIISNNACYQPRPTIEDLALLQLTVPDDFKEDSAVLEFIGGKDPKTSSLLESLIDNGQESQRDFGVESVVTAGFRIVKSSDFSYDVWAYYLLKTKAQLSGPPCPDGYVDLAVKVKASGNDLSICNPFRIDTNVSSIAGTALVLSDHKRPLGLGVYSVFDSGRHTFKYTSLLQNAPNTGIPIAFWVDKKANGGDALTGFFYEMAPASDQKHVCPQ